MVIRPIRPGDKELLSNGLRRLSDQSAQRRFLSPKRTFSLSELRYLTEVDGKGHFALIALDPTDPVHELIAVGRFVALHDEPDAAEVAIVVGDDWQGRGLGSLLTRQLAHAARVRGIRRFTATMAADNGPAHRLLAKLADHLERRHAGSGVDELVLDLAA